MKSKILLLVVTAVTLLMFPQINYAQAPVLGTVADYVLFSSNGAVTNSGTSHLTGNVGTNSGASSGFGNVNGVMHNNDGSTAACAADLLSLYNQLKGAIPTIFPAALLGNGDTLLAGVYSIAGNTSLNLDLILDAKGDANAIFIFQIAAAFSTNAASRIVLINGTQACNVFWKVEGLVSMASGTKMKGNVIANNAAINMNTGVELEGRALSTTGAVTVSGVLAYTPAGCGTPLLTGPAAPNLGSTACFGLFSANGSVTNSGISKVTGDVGSNVDLTTGFNPLDVDGIIHPIPDLFTAACAADLLKVYGYLNTLASDIELLYPAQFGNNLVLTPHTYLMGAAASFTDTVILNAQGNANAVFVIKINGALTTGTYAAVKLINGAQAKNVYWKVEGAVNINDYSDFKGTIICNNGAINLTTGTRLDGRALTTDGALKTALITTTVTTSGCFVLPVNLVYFRGKAVKNNALLEWSTASEQNSASFEINQSLDGSRYVKVGSVAAAGTSENTRAYSFSHNMNANASPVVYYQIKMVDADGKFTYSNIVVLSANDRGTDVRFYPNPVMKMATVTIVVPKKESVNYVITDHAGRTIRTVSGVNLMAGSNILTIDVKGLAVGMYNLSFLGTQTQERVQFIKH